MIHSQTSVSEISIITLWRGSSIKTVSANTMVLWLNICAKIWYRWLLFPSCLEIICLGVTLWISKLSLFLYVIWKTKLKIEKLFHYQFLFAMDAFMGMPFYYSFPVYKNPFHIWISMTSYMDIHFHYSTT